MEKFFIVFDYVLLDASRYDNTLFLFTLFHVSNSILFFYIVL